MNEKGGNHQLLKQKNSQLIRKFIYQNSPVSRVEIAQELGISVKTVEYRLMCALRKIRKIIEC